VRSLRSARRAQRHPGNTVPAKRMPDGEDHEIVIDWDAALTQAAAI
jgi:hypothetical protein